MDNISTQSTNTLSYYVYMLSI